MAQLLPTLTCTPEELAPHVSCLVCAGSKQQLLASFDALLCEGLELAPCSVSNLLPLARPWLAMSERELAATATYLWLSFLQDQGGEEETTFASVAGGAELFANRPQTELLAIQLWIMCQLSMDADLCDAHLLLNYGRCFCVSYKELLAIRVYLLGQFIGNFVQVDLDPDTLHHFIEEFASNISMSMFEATTTWLMCQLYDVALQNQQPT